MMPIKTKDLFQILFVRLCDRRYFKFNYLFLFKSKKNLRQSVTRGENDFVI